MRKIVLALAALVGATVITVPQTAQAAAAGAITFRGMTLTIPSGWRVHRDADRIKVITGRCVKPTAGYFTPKCEAFWIFGPKALKYGQEGFSSYTGKQPFYPASDVQRCPFDGGSGQVIGKAYFKGLRPVGRGHKAAFTGWNGRCVRYDNGRQTATFHQREWFLPTSKILVVDVWDNPRLVGVLAGATWN
ncbi:hypothetical protein [Streptosporangium saharense]|uniref:Uncharacterized protein n=1 Tax=Streptosporangium saharense TaxID=1706840 RepID=A0A7W7QQ08_9ACTN|nr:hypothetical protein [Streptosporangium saharense]MBB4917600.1 hypothetical protein [Streptosporangium saharense]